MPDNALGVGEFQLCKYHFNYCLREPKSMHWNSLFLLGEERGQSGCIEPNFSMIGVSMGLGGTALIRTSKGVKSKAKLIVMASITPLEAAYNAAFPSLLFTDADQSLLMLHWAEAKGSAISCQSSVLMVSSVIVLGIVMIRSYFTSF